MTEGTPVVQPCSRCGRPIDCFVATQEESYGADEELLRTSLPALDLVHNPARPAGPFEAAVWAVWPYPHQSGRIAHHA